MAQIKQHNSNIFGEAFDAYDTDKSGTLGLKQLEGLFKSLNAPMSQNQLKLVSKKGGITRADFIKLMNKPGMVRLGRWLEAFKKYDVNKDGLLTLKEIKMVTEKDGKTMDERMIREFMKKSDGDGDGKINYKEFVESQMGKQLHNASIFAEAFDAHDTDKSGKITINEFDDLLKSLGVTLKHNQLKASCPKGGLTREEFIKLTEMPVMATYRTWLDEFKRYDVNQNGLLSVEQIKKVMEKDGKTMDERMIQKFVKKADGDGDGKINYKEFVDCKTTQIQMWATFLE